MLPINENMSEGLGILGILAPQSVPVGTATLGPFSVASGGRTLFVLQLATPAAGATTSAQVQAAATSGGVYTNVAGASITTITAGANPVALIEVKPETLAAAGQGPFLKLVVTVGVAAQVLNAVALAGNPHYQPASDYNVANVVQTVVV